MHGGTGVSNRHVGFEDPRFVELSRLVRQAQSLRHGRWAVDGGTVRSLARLPVLLLALRRLPARRVPVTDSLAGRRIREYFGVAAPGGRRLLPVSMLALPAAAEEYRRGRHRQAVRTNCSRARRAGVVVSRSGSHEETLARITDLFGRRSDPDGGAWYFGRAALGEGEFWFATGAGGQTLVLAEVVVDRRAAMLRSMISGPGPGRSDARYLIMAEIVDSLIGRGVETLLVDRALSVPPGLVHFQRLLGFVPTRVVFTRLPEDGDGRD